MALYSISEVCRECKYARWHHCEKCFDKPSFCHCAIHAEELVDYTEGTCKSRELKDGCGPALEGGRLEVDLKTPQVDAVTGKALEGDE